MSTSLTAMFCLAVAVLGAAAVGHAVLAGLAAISTGEVVLR